MKKHMMAAAVSMALGLGIASSAQAGVVVNINPDAAGPDATIAVGSLGWNNGNAIATPVAPGVVAPTPQGLIQIFGQAALANFNDGAGNSIGGTRLNTVGGYEWTYVFGFRENSSTITAPGGLPQNANFSVTPGGSNFFQVFFDTARNSSNLTGTGFNDGTPVLSGTIVSGSGTFQATGLGTDGTALDRFVANNYPGITSNTGQGSTQFNATVQLSAVNAAFFPGLSSGMLLNVNTFQNQPFSETDPSGCFWNGTALFGGAGQNNLGTAPAACTNTIGTINGITGPNAMFQTRATNDFNLVPEPGSLALLGLGLLSLVGSFRKRLRLG